jgi:DnaJ-class molecular chaperone
MISLNLSLKTDHINIIIEYKLMLYNPYKILGVSEQASKEDIKRAYRDIALSCHPDKLVNISDQVEKDKRIEKFKQATMAYERLCDGYTEDCCDSWNTKSWQNMWNNIFGEKLDAFMKTKIKPRDDQDPSLVHNIKFDVTYDEIRTNCKKRLRLFLVDIDEPIYINVLCGSFPKIIRQYTDDNDNDHDIIINMNIKKTDGYDHIILEHGPIDLITTVEIDLTEYILGCEKDIPYIDGNMMHVNIPAFQKEYYEIADKGLLGGSLILNVSLKYIDKDRWQSLSEKDKVEMIRILCYLTHDDIK